MTIPTRSAAAFLVIVAGCSVQPTAMPPIADSDTERDAPSATERQSSTDIYTPAMDSPAPADAETGAQP
ncbi:hypothetical protein SAMN06295912_10549 [Sphingomonas laterariae]|uniref:Uncharacterized protein n=1 Tax=Edaphosphingomonas laterariae TaxID=861865 RepID=A0A239DUB5_9SPHN|nr:hypothetical protein [Sphingomonas laterariae]SNS36046.1 hypothetical protein SAMN06295912_10549 [Sphingomonas laterariae]